MGTPTGRFAISRGGAFAFPTPGREFAGWYFSRSPSRGIPHLFPRRLEAFLHPFSQYLFHRGFTFAPDLLGGFDYDALATILMTPDEGVPREMVDALYFVDEMADDQGWMISFRLH